RDSAEERPDHEADIEDEQEFAAIEAIRETRRGEPRDAGAERVRRYDAPELRRLDPELAEEHRPEGREDHEIQDDGELEEREEGDDEDLVTREGSLRGHGQGATWMSLPSRPFRSPFGRRLRGVPPRFSRRCLRRPAPSSR